MCISNNKKLIKYLIWIILITAMLVFVPVGKVKAALSDVISSNQGSISFTEYAGNNRLFCLNHGNPFIGNESFKKRALPSDIVNNINLYKYVVSKIPVSATKSDNGHDYPYQIAIWYLRGTSWTTLDVRGSDDSMDSAKQLLANAYVYNWYIEKNSPIPSPSIEKISDDEFAVYYTKATDNTTISGYTGEYNNLISVSCSDATKVSEKSNKLVSGNTYMDVYKRNSDVYKLTITATYEKNKNATLTYLEGQYHTGKPAYTSSGNATYVKHTIEYHGLTTTTYHHIGCPAGSTMDVYTPTNSVLVGNQIKAKLYSGAAGADRVSISNIHIHKCNSCDHYLCIYQCKRGIGVEAETKTEVCGCNGNPAITTSNFFLMTDTTTGYYPQNLLYGEPRASTTDPKTKTINFIKPVTITFNKKDFNNRSVSGATLSIAKGNNVDTLNKDSITIGSDTVTVQPDSGNSGTFTLTLSESETGVPTGYRGIPSTTITVSYNDGSVTGITSGNTTYVTTSGSTVTIKNIEPIVLTFQKKDFSNNNLSDATLSITNITGASIVTDNLKKSEADGKLGSVKIKPDAATGSFTLTLSETEVPAEYKGIPSTTITVNYSYEKVTSITSNNPTYVPNSTASTTVTIKNKPLVKLEINKKYLLGGYQETLTEGALSGAKFRVEFENIEGTSTFEETGGTINLNNIEPSVVGTDVVATITEIEVPTATGYYYEELVGKVVVTYKLQTSGTNKGRYIPDTITWEDKGGEGAYDSFGNTATSSISDNKAIVNVKNRQLIYLSGMVWKDGQQGEKNIAGPNGEWDEGEDKIAGVLVQLQNCNNSYIVKEFTTGNSGEYEFRDIPKLITGNYRILFNYDGINWQEVMSILGASPDDTNIRKHGSHHCSDAFEGDAVNNGHDVYTYTGRTSFNNKFKTIELGKSNAVNNLDYTYNSSNKTSTLRVTMDGTNPKDNTTNYRMTAYGNPHNENMELIDCGLVNKEIDLLIGTDIEKARLEINDRVTEYTYKQIMDGGMDDLTLDSILQNKSSSKDNVEYNLYLEHSDYHYRIRDYVTDDLIQNNVTEDNEIDIGSSESLSLKELEAFVTYNVILENQTTYEARVDEFVYYYDEIYTPNAISAPGYSYVIDYNNKKITFTYNGGNTYNLTSSSDYHSTIYIEFRVNKDATNGYLILKDDISNATEITKYSTKIGGLIDKDSAPGNANITFTNGMPKVGKDEDDSDEAKGLKISIKENRPRVITGTVFEDKDGDGNLGIGDTKVNDAIVQLIEIITDKNTGECYEYIWQETRSGKNTVKTTGRNGYARPEYTNSIAPESGEYEFKDFIPGNYIIRYIYGDGSTYEITDDNRENIMTYNGQDYRSTKDVKYNKQWYNTAGYTTGQSIARDNEARRLEVMAYSTIIDINKAKAIANKTEDMLENTWMCAETSLINLQIDADAHDKLTTSKETNVEYEDIESIKVEFNDMNFGLTLRPKTQIEIEKHITGLKITPQGTGVQSTVDATANIEKILKGNIEIIGNKTRIINNKIRQRKQRILES